MVTIARSEQVLRLTYSCFDPLEESTLDSKSRAPYARPVCARGQNDAENHARRGWLATVAALGAVLGAGLALPVKIETGSKKNRIA